MMKLLIAGGLVAFALTRSKSLNAINSTAVTESPNYDYNLASSVVNAMIANQDQRNRNLEAFLNVIRFAEGTADDGGWNRLFGGGSFNSYADHPRILVIKSGYKSTAAGAFQILEATWDLWRGVLQLKDFTPASQKTLAIHLIRNQGALDDVYEGRFSLAVSKVNDVWASLPGSPYGQPIKSMASITNVFTESGGVMV